VDTGLTLVTPALSLDKTAFAGGQALVTLADGKTATIKLPMGRQGLGDNVKKFVLVSASGAKTTFTFAAPTKVGSDGDIRIVLGEGKLAQAQPAQIGLTIDFDTDLTWYGTPQAVPFEEGFDEWYTFAPSMDHDKPSEIGMQSWLDAPAGKHGRITRKDGELLYNDKPIKLWGLNICYSSCAPEKELADSRAAFYAKFGVNAVRLHKYADGSGWAGIQSPESFVEFDPAGLDRLDYFIAAMKKKGVYTKLSSTFGVKLGPKDRQYVPYMDEFGKLRGGKGRVSTGHGSVFLSTELQDMQIQQVVNLLKHRNPHTGMTYAEDPTICVVELFNEDSALFYGTMGQLQKIPTLRKRASEAFTLWLKKRYGTEEKLIAAWGDKALNSFGHEKLVGEKWADNTIIPAGNPWYFDPTQLEGSQNFRKARLLDTVVFLYDIQNEFYARYVAAIRKAGYEGEILGSNWQAGRAFSHYFNLHSDSLVGLIDRHNYFGGGGAKINNISMLRVPGSGMLSAGMQQVGNRPFMLSEWIHVEPTEWGVEGPAIIGAYGMGLQGWDVSFMFQNNDSGGFCDFIGNRRWNVTAPQVYGVFPAVARQVLRGDVAQSSVQAVRYVHMPSLAQGRIGFDDRMTQEHDVKTFDSDKVPAKSLAVARCVVEFPEKWTDTQTFDMSKYVKDGVYTSATDQLRWTEGAVRRSGFFTIDTPATKAVVGFAAGQRYELGDVAIVPTSRFGAVYVTAQGQDESIATAKSLLIVAVARSRNTGMKVFGDLYILDKGKSPVVMEPVKARIALKRALRERMTVHILDHDGCKTGRTLVADRSPTADELGVISIDGARDKTCYYLVTFGE
jgi:hypothetical protein